MAGWGFHVGALALAPISLVQATIAGGLVMLTVVADRFFGHQVTRREWIGVGLAAAGLAFLAATLDGGADEAHSDYEAATLVAFVSVVIVAGVLVGGARQGHAPRGGPVRRLGRPALGGLGHHDQGAQRQPRDESAAAILINPMALADPDPLARRDARLRPQPSDRPGRLGDRGDQRRRQRHHDRCGPDRLLGAAARRDARPGRAGPRLRPGDLRRGAHPAPARPESRPSCRSVAPAAAQLNGGRLPARWDVGRPNGGWELAS